VNLSPKHNLFNLQAGIREHKLGGLRDEIRRFNSFKSFKPFERSAAIERLERFEPQT
jgi:hypothetical protein